MAEWIDIPKNEKHVMRERQKARVLRQSRWWQLQIQPGVCHYCGKHVGAKVLTMDHVIPVARGGMSNKGNIVPACDACNKTKNYLTPAEQILESLARSEPQRVKTGMMSKRLIVVHPHGFCSGVARAIVTAENVLMRYRGEAVFCLNEIVHNKQVVDRLTALGMTFVNSLDAIPHGSLLLFSAHGVSPDIVRQADRMSLRVIDATCPFVTKVHSEVRRFIADGAYVICIGHRGHEEVIGVVGEAPARVMVIENAHEAEMLELPVGMPIAIVTQTTLGEAHVSSVMSVLRRKFSTLRLPTSTDVCYATRNRQQAVRILAQQCERVVVLGSANSSNSLRLVETARDIGTDAILIGDLDQLQRLNWNDVRCVGLTSGASTPEQFLDEVVMILKARYGFSEPEQMMTVQETSHDFRLPVLPS